MKQLRIFYASSPTPNAFFQSNLWRNNLYSTLIDLGHDVIELDYDLRETFKHLDQSDPIQKAFIDENRPKLSQALLQQIKTAHRHHPVDVLFSYFYDACILPETIAQIRDMGITTINWYCNGSYQFNLVSQIAPHYDWCLVPEKFRLPDYLAIGAHPIYCQEAANPQIYKHYDVPVKYDVTFVGQAYGDRPAYIKYLLEQGLDVRVWGAGWKSFGATPTPQRLSFLQTIAHSLQNSSSQDLLHKIAYHIKKPFRKAFATQAQDISTNNMSRTNANRIELPIPILGDILSDIEMIQMYSRTKINLGFSTCGESQETGERILQVRLRDFEVPMSGGFYMVEYMEELEEFFRIGQEIVCYTGSEDLAEKIRYYLEHDTEREAIRKAGYERCQKDHTWQKRFESAFKAMGLY